MRKKRRRSKYKQSRNKFNGLNIIKYISFLSLVLYLFYRLITYSPFQNKVIAVFSKLDRNELYQDFIHQNNGYLKSGDILGDVFKSFLQIISNINLNSPNSIFTNGISSINFPEDYGIIDGEFTDDYSNVDNLNTKPIFKPNINNTDVTKPIVYIYNTHQLEDYRPIDNGESNLIPTVLMASYSLKSKLNETGISAYVENSNFYEFLKINNWDYAASYRVSRYYLEDAIKDYKTLSYYIDIHRDSIPYEQSVIEIKGKKYAKILFVLGLENPNYKDNLDLMQLLHKEINDRYPGLSKGILKKAGKGVNGIYNQDVDANVILVEVGSQSNEIEEVDNSIGVLANVLAKIIKGEQ